MKKYKSTLIINFIFFFIDTFLFASPFFTILFLLFSTISAAIRFRRYKKQGFTNFEIISHRLMTLGFTAVTFIIIMLNIYHANKQAEVLISIINKYQFKYKKYPQSLSDMTPEYISKIPNAKYCFCNSKNFRYISIPDSNAPNKTYTELSYTTIHIARKVYHFEKKEWATID